MSPFFPLKYRFAAIISTIAGILLAIVVWQGLFRPYERAHLEQEIRQEVFISFMEDICRTSLLREEYDVLQTYLQKLTKEDSSILHIRIADHRGIIIASSRPSDLGHPLATSTTVPGDWTVRQVKNAAGLLGTISVTFSDQELHNEFRSLILQTVLISLAGLLLLALASLMVGSLLTRRLQQLTAGVQRIAEGDLEVTVPETGRDEVMILGTAINRMSRRLLSLLNDLRDQSERTRAVTDNTLDAIITYDTRGVVQSMNPAALRTFGLQQPLPPGITLGDLIVTPPQDLWQGQQQEEGMLLQLTGRRPDGEEFPVEAAMSQAFLSGQRLFITSIRDISERKKFEAALTRLNQELEQRVRERTSQLEEANGELESFSYSVSHDLRAPLRHINGFCRALQEDCGQLLDSQGRDHLRRVLEATERMGGLIDALLSLSRLGKQALDLQATDLSSLAREVAAGLDQSDPGRQVTWRLADGLTVWADPAMARVVLENLLGNAMKYTARTSQPVVTLERLTSGTEEVYVVRDNGAGFDMRYAEKLFAPFQRLHRPDEFEGTGVGLALVQRIIHRHGGRIWAEGTPGEGASFFFTFGHP